MLKSKYISVKYHENGFVLITYDIYDNNNPLLCKLLNAQNFVRKVGKFYILKYRVFIFTELYLYVKL